MAERMKIGYASARIVFEAPSDNWARTRAFARIRLKQTFQGVRNANIAIAVFDENDNLVGIDIVGNPSEEMKNAMDTEFGSNDAPPAVPA